VCDCCQPDVVQTADGPLIAYRDRSEAEIRDIVVRRGTAAGWSDPVEAGGDDWFIEGCPVNGPAIAASGDDVVLAWFTAAGDDAAVRFARSVDGGRLFLPAFDLDRGAVYGQVGLQLDANGSAYVSWWRRAASGGIDLVVSAVTADGAQAEPIVVGHNDEAQPIDVPQIIAIDDRLLIAWTTFADGGAVRTVSIAKPR
jgi:hypothetical protein